MTEGKIATTPEKHLAMGVMTDNDVIPACVPEGHQATGMILCGSVWKKRRGC